MIQMYPLQVEDRMFGAIEVHLPKTILLIITAPNGYIMCGALDVALINDKLKARQVICARAVGVRTIQELLDAPLADVTDAAIECGVQPGMSGIDALKRMC